LLLVPLRILMALNGTVLRLGRHLAWVALALMVVVISIQVYFRYVPWHDALNWPEEAARFLMLWMTGLIAPSAYRWGGFVAIDMLGAALPRVAAGVLNLILLALALTVLVVAVQVGWSRHVIPGCLFNSATLWVPFTVDLGPLSPCAPDSFSWGGFEWMRVKLAWMYLSLWIGLLWMTVVSVELILRQLVALIDPDAAPDPDPEMVVAGAD